VGPDRGHPARRPGRRYSVASAIALVLFAYGASALGDALGTGWLHGLKVAAAG
jgi:hypothetical protein